MGLTLREVRDEELPLLFEQWADPVAVHMAAFTAPDHMDRDAFERRWSRLRADETVLARVIVVDDDVAGTIGSWGESGEREVTYWIGRSYWGKGIATDALTAFLAVDRSRPLHARVASDNVASRRVLEKCGFRVIATERNVAEARSAEIEELVLRLDELKRPKTEARRRAVPLQARALEALERLPANGGSPLLFPGERGGHLDIHHFRPYQSRPAQLVRRTTHQPRGRRVASRWSAVPSCRDTPGACGKPRGRAARVSGANEKRERPDGAEGEGERVGSYVLGLREIDQTQVAVVGGKGAHLGELSRIEGIRVPAGFCVTTDAFRRIMDDAPSIEDRLNRLSRLHPDDREAIRTGSAEIRRTLEGIVIPDDLAAAITRALARLGERAAYAVRSSATAEDLPVASFAGQQDTYLNVVGPAAILQHVSRCWASLFTERAVTYRLRNSFDHRKVHMAVVVQQMAFPQAAGVLFMADPVTSNRKVASVEASFGLGEAVVSGRVNADVYKVRDGDIVAKAVATKQRAIHAAPGGGTREEAIEPAQQEQPALTDAQVVQLAQLGRRIEAHFGCPQDIEWCLVDDGFQIVQSRPITTLFPIPESDDGDNHVYVSVGHQQMMTDPMKPLGLSLWQLTSPAPMRVAGGRLFVDVTQPLASPASRAGLLHALGKSDPLIRDALQTVLDRGDFIPSLPDEGPGEPAPGGAPAPIETDPAIVTELIGRNQASIAALKRDIRTKSGWALFDFILADIQELKRILFDPQSHNVFMSAMEATWWLNEQLQQWLGEKNAADTLTQSVPHNVTSEMGLALLDVADVIRPHPEVVAFLHDVEGEGFLDELAKLEGGREARDAIRAFLDKYGMRCVGEIDITRPRWSERPTTLLPVILANIKNFEPGAGERRFEQGRQEAWKKEEELLGRLRVLPDGERKAEETKRMIDRVRTFIGYREYPKYGMVSRYFVYKQALLDEAERLVQADVLREKEDIFFVTFQELHDVVRTKQADDELIRRRKEAFRSYQALTPPRVLTSDGEAIAGAYRRDDLPTGALVGLPVSAGTIEGRARVILDMAEADLEPGDILVTAHTDPSWSPLFVAITGLVTEVGGLMTHGAVIAREYGLPAVVGVEHATQLIQDGQRIRVNGTDGYIEILRAT